MCDDFVVCGSGFRWECNWFSLRKRFKVVLGDVELYNPIKISPS
jgi:hypothetical protein